MSTFFNKATCDEFILRINKLSPDTKPQWGKMNAAQMMAHVAFAFSTATGDVKVKRAFIGKLFGGFAKKKYITGDSPFGHNSPTAKEFIMTGHDKNFDEEKHRLIHAIEKFNENGPNGITKEPHTFFGELTPDEWAKLMTKHVDHHLQQFGV